MAGSGVPAVGRASPASRSEGADRRHGARSRASGTAADAGPVRRFPWTTHAVTGTCLISFDRNRYSVMTKAARRAVQVRAYADRIVVRCGDEVVAEHPRFFGRDRMILDPWHYLPVLAKKPGALRTAHRSRAGSCRHARPAQAQAWHWR